MKKIRFGSIEILGCIGLAIWAVVIGLRSFHITGGSFFTAVVGRLPNWGAAWLVTLLGKWLVLFVRRRTYTVKMHAGICAGIVAIAVLSEVFFYMLGRSFDVFDLLVTIVAQLIMFFMPQLTRDIYFAGYNIKH